VRHVLLAVPTFVVMFFLMNSIPRHAALFGYLLAPSGCGLRKAWKIAMIDPKFQVHPGKSRLKRRRLWRRWRRPKKVGRRGYGGDHQA
jgi:hypothetical protein